jgi:hypothetical protein
MGKRSRLKREARAAALPAPLAVLASPPPQYQQEQAFSELSALLHGQAEIDRCNREIERLNHLPIGHPENAHKIGLTFDPIEGWLRELLATGGEMEVLVGGRHAGVAIFKPRSEDEWYPIAESFRAVYDTFELIATEFGVEDRGQALLRLANKIEADMPLEARDVDRALEAIAWMKDLVKPLTPARFSDFSGLIQARAIIREQGLDRHTT